MQGRGQLQLVAVGGCVAAALLLAVVGLHSSGASGPSALAQDNFEALSSARGGANLDSAARLLAKARAAYSIDDRAASYLDSQAQAGIKALGSPSQIRAAVRKEVADGAQAQTSGLQFSRGWPQAGGAMPTDFGEPASWGSQQDGMYYPDEDIGDDYASGPGVVDIGVVGGGAKRYANGWGGADESSGSTSGSSPFYWFLKGASSPTGGDFASSSSGGSDYWDDGYSSSVRDPVKKLIAIKRQRNRLAKMQDDVAGQVYDSASAGGMSGYVPDSQEQQSFMGGFLEGAVQASRKSMEQQGEFARQLESQSRLVGQLENIVGELQEEMRRANWKKTEEKVNEQDGAAKKEEEKGGGEKSADEGEEKESDEQQFNVEFYMEAECPACKSFAKNILPTVLNAFGDMINLTTVPFGNAAVINGTIFCQHGPAECMGNKIELCVMEKYPKWQQWFPAFKCIEKSYDSPENASKVCLPKFDMDLASIMECARGDEGELLHLKAAKQTLNLNPPHKWTPWVVLNGEPLGEKTNGILRTICEKLPKDKTDKIQACNPKYADMHQKEILAATEHRCYPDPALDRLMFGK